MSTEEYWSKSIFLRLLQLVSKGKMTSEEAAGLLIKPCVCGIGNKERIGQILDSMVESNLKKDTVH